MPDYQGFLLLKTSILVAIFNIMALLEKDFAPVSEMFQGISSRGNTLIR
jgi:hypothetical protein